MSARPPRLAYWLAGAVIACGGALGARLASEQAPTAFNVPIWLTGCAVIFTGLAVLSFGARRGHTESDNDAPAADEPGVVDAGAGHRRRHNTNGDGNGTSADSDGNGGGNGGNGGGNGGD